MSRLMTCLLALGLLLGTTSATRADEPLVVNGGWQGFSFDAAGSFSDPSPFVYNSASPTVLKVTDAFLSGDQFKIYDFGVSLGLTSAPESVGDQVGSDADAAYADARWSSGTYVLAAGAHEITIETVVSPFNGGGAFIRADVLNPVPEPLSCTLFGVGLVGMAGYGWRRRK